MVGDVTEPSTDMVVRSAHDEDALMVQLSSQQLDYIARTDFVPPGLRGNKPAILACIATGRSLGISDMTALRSIHIIDGKPTFSAELMVQLVRRRGHSITGSVGDGIATVTGTRTDTGDEMTSTWTLQMAERAGLSGRANWKKYPEAMLWARAVSQLCRMLFADCFSGATHTPEEIAEGDYEDYVEDSAGEPQAEVTSAPAEPESAVSDADPAPGEQPSPADTASAAQLKKLNVLVGTLREAGHITTEQIYKAMGRDPVVSDDGDLHWSPLRDALTKDEASALIERLTALEGRVASAA